MSINENNATIVSTCNQRITGLTKLVKPKTAMKINRKLMKLSDVIAVYQACIDARSEVLSARAAYEATLAVRDSADSTRRATDKGLKAWALFEFGVSSTEAKELGFVPPIEGTKSVVTKARAVEKSLATRKARQTMGKRQKADANPRVPVEDFVELRVVA